MDKIYNIQSKRFNTLKTAKKNGLINNPEKFILPKNKLLVKTDDDKIILVDKSKSSKFFKDEDDEFLTKYNKEYTYNPKTKRIVNKTKQNVKKVYTFHKDKLFTQTQNFFSQEDPNPFVIKLNKVKLNDILDTIIDFVKFKDGAYILEAGGKYITLNQTNINKLEEQITKIENAELGEDSFGQYIESIIDNAEMEEITLKKYKGKKKQDGAFFNKINKTKIDLSRYAIYEEFNSKNYEDNCIITTLKNGGMDDVKIEYLKQMIRVHHIPMSKLKLFVEKYDICFKIWTERRKEQGQKILIIGNKNSKEVYNIGLVNNHYFINEPINMSWYAIKHYEEFEGKEWNEFKTIQKKNGNGYYKNDNNKVMSFDLIYYMFNQGNRFFEDFSNEVSFQDTCYYDLFKEIKTLEYDEELCLKENKFLTPMRKESNRKNEKYINYTNVFFDFETYVCKQTRRHIPYLCCIYKNENMKQTFYGEDCGRKMLDSLSSDTRLIAHNSSYDYTFINKYLTSDNIIMKGKKLINGEFKYFNNRLSKEQEGYINIQIKDSSSLITAKLSKFGEMFQLEQGKEVMPYKLYNKDTINQIYVSLTDTKKFLDTDEEYNQLIENCKKWNILKGDMFNIIAYSSEYCMIDCKVLCKGYWKFREWIKEATELDINNYFTLPSLANAYLLKQGCYDGVYKMSGNVRSFIQKAVIGGRTMLRNNQKQYVKGKIADFDGVSLYPSSMKRISGFPLGKPKVLKTTNYGIVKNYDMYVVEIIIKEVNKSREFPLMSYITDEGVRNWSNNMKNKRMVVDKTTLEDLITFQEIEFDIVRGYYYDEGFNTTINKVIEHLFNERLKKKKEKNPIQVVYKLLMNSAYGKTILKPIDSETKTIKGEEEAIKYVVHNYNKIIEFFNIPLTDKYVIKEIKPILEHFNNATCGVNILSMSKRIMNEVMCLGEDLKMNIYYTDTDSIHIDYDSVNLLSKEFNKKYGRELCGKQLGQFHIDFEMEGAKGDSIYSTQFIGLGKKCYIDKLVGKNEKGEDVEGHHIRLKGISESSIHHLVKQEKTTLIDLYQDMYDEKTKTFDLLCGGDKDVFEFSKFTYSMKERFERSVKFLGIKAPKVLCF